MYKTELTGFLQIMQLPALVFTQIFLSRMVFSLKRMQVDSHTSFSNSNVTNSNPESGPSHSSSGQQEKSGGSGATLVDQNRKNSASEKVGLHSRTSSVGKPDESQLQSQPHSRRPSKDDASIATTYQSHRRGSSVTLIPSPGVSHLSGEQKFANHSMNTRSHEDIPPVPSPTSISAVPIPPFANLPAKYQNYRLPHRTMPGGRFRRQTSSRDSNVADVAGAAEHDDPNQSEAGDRVLEIKSSYSQPPAVYPYLFEPPGTATSSLPPHTATSDVANRSSGEFEYRDERALRLAQMPPQSAPQAATDPVDPTSARQSYHTPSSSVADTPPV